MEKATKFSRLFPSDHKYLLKKARKGGGTRPIAEVIHEMVETEKAGKEQMKQFKFKSLILHDDVV